MPLVIKSFHATDKNSHSEMNLTFSLVSEEIISSAFPARKSNYLWRFTGHVWIIFDSKYKYRNILF
jgi:hypothetical protein